MNLRIKMLRLSVVMALAVGMLAEMVGLFGFNGPSPVSAQADTTPPTILSTAVTSVADHNGDGPYWRGTSASNVRPSGTYGIGDSIKVTVTFSENVFVVGAPQLMLDIGGSARTGGYESTAAAEVVFSYTVAEGDSDSDGIAVASNKLSLNGGSIKDAAGNDANLSHNALAAQDGHMVDGIRPTVSAISIFSGGAGYDDVFNIGDEMFANIRFSEAVRIGGEPQLTLDFDGEAKTAKWIGDLFFDFSYLIQEGDLDTDGVAIGANALSLNGGTIKDAAGNDAVLTHDAVGAAPYIVVDGVRPTVSSIAITSDPGEDDTYGTGDKIEVTVTFSEKMIVPVVAGDCPDVPDYCMPQLELDIGGEARTAEYQNTKGAAVVFAYNVQAGDTDENGIAIRSNKLTLNGGRIEDAVGIGIGANLADVSHAAVAADTGHKVVGPSLPLTLSGITMTEHQENDDMSVATYWVSGSDAAITWSLSGDDSDDFSIDKNMWQNGVLRFTSPPNYENPTDADTDNLYRVTIQASDGTNASTLQIVVLVRNVWLDADEVPVISGTVRVGETLTADTSRISRPFSLGPWYWWIRSDGTTDTEIEGATGASYTLTDADAGKTVKVRVNFYVKHSVNFGFVSLTSEATAMVAALGAEPNSLATGAPVIGGTAQVGETLTVDTSGIADADGLTGATFSYQWLSSRDTEIWGATSFTYTLLAADEGKTIKVRVSFTDAAGHEEALTSEPTDAVVALTQADSEDEPSLRSYITVVVAEDTSDPDNPQTDFTITWSDIDACSTGYNAYLNSWTYANGRDRTHLGSAATDGSRITSSLSNVEGEGIIFDVELYCGTEDSGRLVSSVSIPRDDGRLVPSTYSSEPPLTALTVSPGTLTPMFHSHTLDYTVADVVSDDIRLTLVATAKPDYSVVFVKDIIGGFTYCSPWDYWSCSGWQYQDGDHNRVYPLTDADGNEPGFQVDLAAGEELSMHVIRLYRRAPLENKFYRLTVTRVPNSPATGLPTINGILQVGHTLTAGTSGIAD